MARDKNITASRCTCVCIRARAERKNHASVDRRRRRRESFRHRMPWPDASRPIDAQIRRGKKREERRALPVALVPEPPRLPGCSCPEKTLLTHLSDIVRRKSLGHWLNRTGAGQKGETLITSINDAELRARDRDERARKSSHGSRSSSLTRDALIEHTRIIDIAYVS